jgi:hypothetical protein
MMGCAFREASSIPKELEEDEMLGEIGARS